MAFDVAIVGGGPGGYVAAIRAAQLGGSVCLVEQGLLGGTCLNRGCIPTKTLLATATLVEQIKQAAAFGVEVDGYRINPEVLRQRKEAVGEQLRQGIATLLRKNKVEVISGRASLAGPGRLAVVAGSSTEAIEARNIILATGSEPAMITSLGYDGRTVITSNEALELEEIPESLLIIGGGVVGCEMATFYQAMGTRVTIVEMMPNILPTLDRELARRQQSILKRQGIEIHTKAAIARIQVDGGWVVAELEGGQEIKVEKALISIGRVFNTAGIGLAEAGVQLGPRGEVLVNEYLETSLPGVYAIGDITNKVQLAHVASAQGKAAAANALGERVAMDYRVIPNCIFTEPEIASVGLTQDEAAARGMEVKVGKFPFTASGKALAMGQAEGAVKIISEAGSGRLVGIHIHGPHASDLIGEAALAVAGGWSATQLAEVIHAHPTLPEALAEAAEAALGRAIHA
ncbi:MAG: dihydrolipoyl dehydrogenase [Clostridia bacterium]|nr:MAG: dihydrolipoyl dehydrogenase [Clostridia bacterium]